MADSSDQECGKVPIEYLNGFPTFAAYIASDPELAIYRKFDFLSARNLLYLQSELIALEAELKDYDAHDFIQEGKENMDVKLSSQCWEVFAIRARDCESEEAKRMKVIRKIRVLMKEYQEALLLQSQMLKLKNPSARVLEAFEKWLNLKTPLIGLSKGFNDASRDLVALSQEFEPDRLSRLLQDLCGSFLREKRNDIPISWGPMYYFKEQSIAVLVAIFSTLLSAVLLIGAILSLKFVTSAQARLGMISGFTILFASSIGLLTSSIGLLTSARRPEIFAATAAYAAVLVVFVSGNLGSS